MASTVIRGAQIKDSTVQRHDLDTSTVGQAVVTKVVQGSGITLSSTGADSGTGDVTVSGVSSVSTDAGNIATLGSDSKILVPQSQIWSVRLRSFNAVGNPSFEVTQRNCGSALSNPAHGTMIEDRWAAWNNGALNPTFQVGSLTTGRNIPGTSFSITRGYMGMKVNTVKSSLAATDLFGISTQIESSAWRELQNDVHSLSLLLRSTVNCKLGVSLRDGGTVSKSLTKLVTLTANTDTLVQLPNLPVWPAGNFTNAAGSASYSLSILLACGSTFMSPANDTWQSGNFVGAVGQDNYLANPINSEVDVFFVQHEPGAQCSTLIDCPFSGPNGNIEACKRYYQKSYSYAEKPGIVQTNGAIYGVAVVSGWPQFYTPFKVSMATTPPYIFGYSPNTGTINAVRDQTAAVDRGINSAIYANENGFGGFNVTSTNAAIAVYGYHYTADTGM